MTKRLYALLSWMAVITILVSAPGFAQESEGSGSKMEGSGSAAKEKAPSAKYVGSKKCKLCHSTDKLAGTAYKVWSKASHAKAFEELKSEKAIAAAKEMGVDDPSKSEKCLTCHTTPTLEPEEGVSCERCHGAAENWLKPHGQKDESKRPPMAELVKMGKKDLSKKEDQEKMCLGCHADNPDNPFNKPFNFDESWAKINHGKKKAE